VRQLENIKENGLQLFSKFIPFEFVNKFDRSELLVVYYHIVNDDPVPHIKHLYQHKDTRQFCDDLDFLASKYTPINIIEAIQWVNGKASYRNNNILLTFDDGFCEIYDVVAPILIQKGFSAVFFLSSAFLDNRELCYQHKESLLVERIAEGISRVAQEEIKRILVDTGVTSSELSEGILNIDYHHREALDNIAKVLEYDFRRYLDERHPYLSSVQVRQLIKSGFGIGAHSVDHPYYSQLSLHDQLEQTIVSSRLIRETFGLDYGAFAFPHNDTGVSLEFFEKIRESRLLNITFGTGGFLESGIPTHKHRISLENPMLPAKLSILRQYVRKLYRQLNRNNRPSK
jgi:peptidoglycan/xylan/chitin deacetylase (PgdA/CDA1 family)